LAEGTPAGETDIRDVMDGETARLFEELSSAG